MFGMLDEGLAISIGHQRPEFEQAFEQAFEQRVGGGQIRRLTTARVVLRVA